MNTRPLLVLDLDETIWYGEIDRVTGETTRFEVRPYLTEFLDDVTPHWDIAAWTAGTDLWVDECFPKVLTETGHDLWALCKFVWTREKCIPYREIDYGPYSSGYPNTLYRKPARKFRTNSVPSKYPRERILSVDDKPHGYRCGYGHVIRISEWTGDPSDHELMDLAVYLNSIKDEPNLTSIEKRGWRNRVNEK